MKLKLNEQGLAIVRDGKPVYVHADGREEAFDAPTAMKMLVGKHFETSTVAGRLKLPHEIAAAAFGGAFRINERGQLIAFKGDIPMYSHTRHGEVANFEEALTQIIDSYPNKDMIQRKDGSPSPGQQSQQVTTVTRVQFDAMPPATRAKFFADGGRIEENRTAPTPTAQTAAKPANGKTIKRSEFDVMPPKERAEHFRAGGAVVD